MRRRPLNLFFFNTTYCITCVTTINYLNDQQSRLFHVCEWPSDTLTMYCITSVCSVSWQLTTHTRLKQNIHILHAPLQWCRHIHVDTVLNSTTSYTVCSRKIKTYTHDINKPGKQDKKPSREIKSLTREIKKTNSVTQDTNLSHKM